MGCAIGASVRVAIQVDVSVPVEQGTYPDKEHPHKGPKRQIPEITKQRHFREDMNDVDEGDVINPVVRVGWVADVRVFAAEVPHFPQKTVEHRGQCDQHAGCPVSLAQRGERRPE